MSFQIGIVMLFVVIAILMAIASAAQKGGPLMLPVAVILLGLALIIERGGAALR